MLLPPLTNLALNVLKADIVLPKDEVTYMDLVNDPGFMRTMNTILEVLYPYPDICVKVSEALSKVRVDQ